MMEISITLATWAVGLLFVIMHNNYYNKQK